jgi:hypothetical protein
MIQFFLLPWDLSCQDIEGDGYVVVRGDPEFQSPEGLRTGRGLCLPVQHGTANAAASTMYAASLDLNVRGADAPRVRSSYCKPTLLADPGADNHWADSTGGM